MANNILRLPAVTARTGLSRSTLYNKLNPKSPYFDPHFPAPINLGVRAVGWDDQSVQEWIDRQIECSRKAGRKERLA